MEGNSFEFHAHNMVPYKGLRRQIGPLSYFDWRAADGSVISGASSPAFAVQDNIGLFNWAFNKDGSVPLMAQVVVPDDFDPQAQTLVVEGLVRKKDAGADENATLKLQANVRFWNPNDAASQTLATPAELLLPGPVAGTDLTGWTSFALDLGARFAAESKKLAAGQALRLYLFPSAQVGTTDMALQVCNLGVYTRRHMVPRLDSRR